MTERPNKMVDGVVMPLSDAEWAAYQDAINNPPPPAVPQSITPRQARLALLGAGLLSSVDAAVSAADEATRIAWDYATQIDRDNPIIAAMAGQLVMTAAQVDDLFRNAAAL